MVSIHRSSGLNSRQSNIVSAAVDERDVAQVQVAVALADEAAAPPFVQPRPQRRIGRRGPRLEPGQRLRVAGEVGQPADVGEVLHRVVEDVRRHAVRPVGRRRVDAAVKRGDLGGELVDQRRRQRAAREHLRQQGVLREFAHPHRVVQHRAVAFERGRGRTAADGDDVEIEVGREPAVESQFLGAEVPARFQRAEVEEPEVDGLLDLVGEFAGQQHPGDVRFDQGDRTPGLLLEPVAQPRAERLVRSRRPVRAGDAVGLGMLLPAFRVTGRSRRQGASRCRSQLPSACSA